MFFLIICQGEGIKVWVLVVGRLSSFVIRNSSFVIRLSTND